MSDTLTRDTAFDLVSNTVKLMLDSDLADDVVSACNSIETDLNEVRNTIGVFDYTYGVDAVRQIRRRAVVKSLKRKPRK
jgi:hypothetical protein